MGPGLCDENGAGDSDGTDIGGIDGAEDDRVDEEDGASLRGSLQWPYSRVLLGGVALL